MIYFTSDLHFNHRNILKYEAATRPFETTDEMNEVLIKNWNDTVAPEDMVYVLGDLSMGQLEDAEACVKRLNGKIILVRGNHDTPKRLELYKQLGIEIHDIYYLHYKGRYFICCHFPIASAEFMRMVVKDNSEVVNLYGHLHSHAPVGYKDGTFHVGVDTNGLRPISIEEIWNQCWPSEQLAQPEVKAYYELAKDNPNFEN